MAIKPTIPSGTRDFSPTEVYKRQYIFNTIKTVFEKFGYQPIETPTMENLSTLEGKYGEEGDRLLYRILDSGSYHENIVEIFNKKISNLESWRGYLKLESENEKLSATEKLRAFNAALDLLPERERVKSLLEEVLAIFPAMKTSDFTSDISGKGLRYDLTVPFARYVVMHQNEITFPFKRYQIQSVFRADRPQRGRYREFFQCDADVVGSDSLLYETELIQIYDEVFSKLGINTSIKINNRKILVGITESINAADRFIDITIAIDKLDKIGLQGVRQELTNRGLSESQIQVIEKFFSIEGNGVEKLAPAKNLLSNSPTGLKGIAELENIFTSLAISGETKNKLEIDFTLARGLNYYTGAIIEVKPNDVKMGSIGGGGRYDDLTGMFGLKNVSGVGISFGADRIYDVMEELKLFPSTASKVSQVLFINFDEASENFSLPLLKQIRDAGIASEIYPSAEKMKKQMKYADDKKIPFVIFTGENERSSGKLTLKDMESGDQSTTSIEELIQRLK